MKSNELLGIFTDWAPERYFADPGINKSGLDAFARSPLHYWAKHISPEREEREETPAMRFGSAIHCMVLEPEKFAKRYAWTSAGYDGRTKDGKSEYARLLESGLKIVSFDQVAAARAIAQRLKNSPAAEALFAKGDPEVTLTWDDAEHGERCKARPDWISESGILVDIKSSEDARPGEFSRSCATYAYHRQAAWYLDGYKAATGRDALGFVFAVFEKTYPFACAYYITDDETLALGREDNRRLLARYAECKRTNDWPGYPETIEPLGLPAWARKRDNSPNTETF